MYVQQKISWAEPCRQEAPAETPHKIIRTKRGIEILVDESDYEWLNQWKWTLTQGHATRKAQDPTTGKKHTVYMHRLIMGVTDRALDCDHKNMVRHDNRRSNLRVTTRSFNNCNTGPRKTNKLGIKGVYFVKWLGKYVARIQLHKKNTHLGVFLDKDDAARAYDRAAIKLHGEFARTNFPLDDYK